jgi:hypothetical protein
VYLRASRKPLWSDSSPYVSPQQTTDKGVDVTEDNAAQGNAVWILMDAPEGGDLAHYAGPVQIDAEKLKQHFLSFTSAVSKTSQGLNPWRPTMRSAIRVERPGRGSKRPTDAVA